MKKVLISIAIALLPTLVMTSYAQAQKFASNTPITVESTSSNLINSSEKSLKDEKKAAREFKQFNRITRNFQNKYEGATHVAWTKHKTGYSVNFTRDGLQNIIWYYNDGSIQNSMVSYEEQNLPRDVKRVVEDYYEDYNIVLVNEVHQGNIVVYVVTIENDKNIKLVTVCEGELNIYQEYKKR